MPQFDLTAADALMKIKFNPRIIKQFNTAAVLWNRFFEGKGEAISNRGLEIPIHTAPSGGSSWYLDGGTLPAGSSQVFNRASVGFFSFAKSIQLTGSALDSAGKDEVTYARALAINIKNAAVDAIKELNMYSFLDATGTIAQVGAGVTLSTSINSTVDVTGNSDNGRYLRPDMRIDFLTGFSGALKASATIVSVSTVIGFATTPATIVVGPATSAAVLASADGIALSGSTNKVIAGLKLIVDDGTVSTSFQGINRTNVPQYKAPVNALTGSPALARDHLRKAIADIQISRGGVNLDQLEIWSHPSQLHAYADMGWPLKRFNDANKKLDLGFTAYEWEGTPWVIDTDAPKDHIFFLDRSSMLKTTARELSFDDRTGSVLRQVPSSTAGRYDDTFVAFLLFRGNLGAYAPNANQKTKGLGVPSGY